MRSDTTVQFPLDAERHSADPELRVLWLSDLVEVTREGTSPIPPYQRMRYEITFQLLLGPGYREYHRYVVQPRGVEVIGDNAEDMKFQFGSWRVIEYKLAGWDFHWGDGAGHRSSVRRP
jgi:hypothetical protein